MFSTSDREFHGRSHALEPHTTVPNRRLRAGDEEAENVADLDLGPVDVTEHKRDPSGPIVTSTTDTRLRDLTLLVDERSEVTSGSFVARACPDDCDASSCEEEDVLDQNAPLRHAADLLLKAATSAPFEGRPMYAALRAIPIPDDVVARLFHAASLLREHRGDGHIAALMIEGVGGLEAHVLFALDMAMPAENFGRIARVTPLRVHVGLGWSQVVHERRRTSSDAPSRSARPSRCDQRKPGRSQTTADQTI